MEEPGEAGSFNGNGRLFPYYSIEGPMKVHEFLEKEGASLYKIENEIKEQTRWR